MKKLTLLLTATLISVLSSGQEIEQELKHFRRIVASPRINVILNKGDNESIRLVYRNISRNKININVTGKTLRIYLDNAKNVEGMKRKKHDYGRKEKLYEDATVTAYITYTKLEMLEIRGNQELKCKDPIVSEDFVLRAYGENEITLSSLKTAHFKAKLYGENHLKIRKGSAREQQYFLYGENKIDTRKLRSKYSATRIFGDGSLRINSSEEVRIDAFGEPRIYVDGGASVNRRLVIGEVAVIKH